MPGLNFGQILEAALSGGMQGYAKQRQMNAENQLAARKIQNEENTSTLKADEQGFAVDPTTGGLRADPGFYTPGNPSYERARQNAEFKRMGHPLSAALLNPNNAPINPALQSSLEQTLGLQPGSLNGTTQGKGLGSLSYVTGQAGQNARQDKGLAAQGERQNNQLSAEEDRQARQLKQQKELQTGRFSTGSKASDTAFSKQYNDWTSGDRSGLLDTADQLDEVSRGLRAYKPPMGISGLGYAAQFVPGSELGDLKNQAEAAGSSGLKEKFGSRISNLDLAVGLKFTYNPKLTPQQNADLIDKKVGVLRSKIADRDAKSEYYEGHDNSLYGYKPTRASLYQGGDEGGDAIGVSPDVARDKAKAKGGGAVGVNGNVISGKTIKDIQSMPDKGTLNRPQKGAKRILPDPDKPGKKMTVVFDGKAWNEQ